VKKAEENAFQLLEHVATNDKLTLEDLYKLSYDEQLAYVNNVIEKGESSEQKK
jgi:hypothetical protein